jgi:hypothetical protein
VDEMDGAFIMHRTDEKSTLFFPENLNVRDFLKDLQVNDRIIIKWILKK